MGIFLSIITWLAAAAATFILWITFSESNGAPQEAAGAALALGVVVIPYCVTSITQRAEILAALRRRD